LADPVVGVSGSRFCSRGVCEREGIMQAAHVAVLSSFAAACTFYSAQYTHAKEQSKAGGAVLISLSYGPNAERATLSPAHKKQKARAPVDLIE